MFFLELRLVLFVVNRAWLFTSGSGADPDLKIEKMANPDRIRISFCWIRSGSGSLNLWIRPPLMRTAVINNNIDLGGQGPLNLIFTNQFK